jgi:hypothetical protein
VDRGWLAGDSIRHSANVFLGNWGGVKCGGSGDLSQASLASMHLRRERPTSGSGLRRECLPILGRRVLRSRLWRLEREGWTMMRISTTLNDLHNICLMCLKPDRPSSPVPGRASWMRSRLLGQGFRCGGIGTTPRWKSAGVRASTALPMGERSLCNPSLPKMVIMRASSAP